MALMNIIYVLLGNKNLSLFAGCFIIRVNVNNIHVGSSWYISFDYMLVRGFTTWQIEALPGKIHKQYLFLYAEDTNTIYI